MLRLVISLLVTVAPPAAADTDVAETLLRAVSYDKNLEARTPEGFRLGVAFEPNTPASKQSAEDFVAVAKALGATGSDLAPSWVELVGVEDAAALYRWLKENHVSALYVPEDMEASIDAVVKAAEAAGVFTIAGSPNDVEDGLVAGLRVADGSKKLVVNMAAAERCGIDFDAAVRQVAQRVGGAPAKDDRDQLSQALGRYSDAIQERNLDALRGVWPTLDGDDEKRIVASFKMARSHKVAFAVLRVESQGGRASARVRRVDHLVTKDGQKINAGTVVDIAFSKVADGWQIDSMANATPPS